MLAAMSLSLPASIPMDGRQSERALAIARGVGRLFHSMNETVISEVPLRSGRRADLVAIGKDGSLTIVEIKSSIADLKADHKWPDYRLHCDRLFFATLADVPAEIFPSEAGLIIADAYGAEIVRSAPTHALPAATRKEMLIRLARIGAMRWQRLADPDLGDLNL
jgi:hypothetical protein